MSKFCNLPSFFQNYYTTDYYLRTILRTFGNQERISGSPDDQGLGFDVSLASFRQGGVPQASVVVDRRGKGS